MRELIRELEEIILAGSGVDAFREIFKLLYVKLYIEKHAIVLEKDAATINHFQIFLGRAKLEWPGIFFEHESFTLPEQLLFACFSILEKIELLQTDLSVIDAAFEQLLPSVAKGNRGQYFTPRHVIAAVVSMLRPTVDEYIIDPAVGSGGFLIETIRTHRQKQFAAKYVYGIDFDERAYMACKALLLIAGHGDTHVYKGNSLESLDVLPLDRKLFDVVLTNPPFGGEIRDRKLLEQYTLSYDAKGRQKRIVERHLLFLERVIQLLRPGGRAGIIVPQGLLNNINLAYVRNWLFQHARVLGVIGMDTNTFKPYTNVKTSLLLIQKWESSPLLDYPIFMAVSKQSGKSSSGKEILLNGRVQSDLEAISVAFRDFVSQQSLQF